VFGLTRLVHYLSLELFDKDMPETVEEVGAVFTLIENSVQTDILDQMYNARGIRLLFTTSASNTEEFERIGEVVMAFAESPTYADVEILPFEKTATYASTNQEIVIGKPLNVLASQILVMAVCAAWMYVRERLTLRASIRAGAAMSIPFLFSSAAILIVMMTFAVPLDIATAAIGPLSINASIDFSVYYAVVYVALRRRLEHDRAVTETMESEGVAITTDFLLNTIVFMPLVFLGTFIPVERLGWMMVTMLFFAWVGAMMVMPPALRFALEEKEGSSFRN
jgi:predicted RND superfamily exporter protein